MIVDRRLDYFLESDDIYFSLITLTKGVKHI